MNYANAQNPYANHQSANSLRYPQQQVAMTAQAPMYGFSNPYAQMQNPYAQQTPYPSYNYAMQPNAYQQQQLMQPNTMQQRMSSNSIGSTNTNNPMGNSFNIYQLARQIIANYADSLFVKHDKNKSGFLDVNEMYACVSELYAAQSMPIPQFRDVINIMTQFDEDKNGLIDKTEFKKLLMIISGNM